MLYIIISDNKEFRAFKTSETIQKFEDSDIISVDDATMALIDLEQFLYPSLFTSDAPIVHGKFLLEGSDEGIDFYKKLSASPTIFIFEELTLPAAVVATLKKSGAEIHVGEKQKSKKQTDDIFEATQCLTAKDKKSRWLAYRKAVGVHAIEAILGILYWKVRSLASKSPPGNEYEQMYKKLLEAQSRAWRTGAPLEALIEKVILSQ